MTSEFQNSNTVHETCEVCGFEWAAISPSEITVRITGATDSLRALVLANLDQCRVRPHPDRWSVLEYASHVRDVLLGVRDRIIVACVEDAPRLPPLYRDQRVDLGLYQLDNPSDVCDELKVASNLFLKIYQSLPADYLERSIFAGYPVVALRNVLWTAAQALHECEHHLSDAQEDIELLG